MKILVINYHLVEVVVLGVNLMPMGFLVVSSEGIKMLPVNHCSAIDKLLDYVPDLLDKIEDMWNTERTYTYEFYDDDDECTCGCVTKEKECKCSGQEDVSKENDSSKENEASNGNETK